MLKTHLLSKQSKHQYLTFKRKKHIYGNRFSPYRHKEWDIEDIHYQPCFYTHPTVLAKPVWADPDLFEDAYKDIKFNQVDGLINRTSHTGAYLVLDGIPRNPRGRIGIAGRGLLGKWGPNHAADPAVTRWRKEGDGVMEKLGQRVLEIVLIRKANSKHWALPGGMIEDGDTVDITLKKEFSEEALNFLTKDEAYRKDIEERYLNKIFQNGVHIYSGLTRDKRDTDNAWIETVAKNYHDETGELTKDIPLEAGDDAVEVQWFPVSSDLPSCHANILEMIAKHRRAYF
eukprot:TRINITY_DN7575_c0_g1_i1.p1 TRINITY_DN7575_c0_g1~~TRINITY_DN7575_c0_g1_i1.p1  ORF type:complete len:286 (+),score=51.89 TRINITY_DN7575_c0_g1_i1:66-923(+)